MAVVKGDIRVLREVQELMSNTTTMLELQKGTLNEIMDHIKNGIPNNSALVVNDGISVIKRNIANVEDQARRVARGMENSKAIIIAAEAIFKD